MRSHAELAVMMRSVQWRADQAAFEIGARRYTAEQRRELAKHLRAVADELYPSVAGEAEATRRSSPGYELD